MSAGRGFAAEEALGRVRWLRLQAAAYASVAWLSLRHWRAFRSLRRPPAAGPRYVRPPRRYDLPAPAAPPVAPARPRRYLRPTRFCDCRDPLVAAVARTLGAGTASPGAYAEAAFSFVKERMNVEVGPLVGVGETLRRGTGSCLQLVSVFVALARAAGIPARYKLYAMRLVGGGRMELDPLARRWYDALGYFAVESEAEVLLDGAWVVADVGHTAEREAAAGLPVGRLGEDAIGRLFIAVPGSVMRLEALPRGIGFGTRLLSRLSPASVERMNLGVQEQQRRGEAVIAGAGGAAAWDAAARARARGPASPEVPLEARAEIRFER